MEPIEMARKLAAYGETAGACKGYAAAVAQGLDPQEELEAAVYILLFGGDYRVSYTSFLKLYRQGLFQDSILPILDGAFYQPNEKDLKKRYETNCKLLKKYPYFFRKDFLPFEDLPIRFFPYEGHAYVPFYPKEGRFGELIDFREPVIRHYFFRDLENPILAEDIFSQYELEYLNDNVRKSEYVARENHIYLHYTDWPVFCAYLQCWNLRPLLADEKFVFLLGDEISQYPIDFKARFGIDYSRYPLKPIGVREIHRLIWHTQLSTHNGGDFFNEVFDAHPNLLVMPSLLLDNVEQVIGEVEETLGSVTSDRDALQRIGEWPRQSVRELYLMKNRTPKDILTGFFLNDERAVMSLDRTSRIAPALFFQPHFENLEFSVKLNERNQAVLFSDQFEKIQNSPAFRNFKYIKTFTPMRRVTTSYAATVRFMDSQPVFYEDIQKYRLINDELSVRILNRSFMIDPQDRLYKDSVLVRFEDGKLNPKATFTALAEFLDLPYTESMTYCSEFGKINPHPETKGFDPVSVYRTYDQYANDAERTLIEYFMRDVYEYYGYDFQYYDGGPMDENRLRELIRGCTTIDGLIRETHKTMLEGTETFEPPPEATREEIIEACLKKALDGVYENRAEVMRTLMQGVRFVNQAGQPLRMMPKLQLDPELLEQPLYH